MGVIGVVSDSLGCGAQWTSLQKITESGDALKITKATDGTQVVLDHPSLDVG